MDSPRRRVVPLLVFGSLVVLALWCFGEVLFRGRQFGYRDAAHYYYPLYQRVQQEWAAGRWPLWEPGENAGMPLLGNPTAAVFYPGKLLYAALPYAWAARLYVVAHTTLAFAAMLVLMRSWGTSWAGSGLSALAYAFGAPILLLYANVVFLVGAAWAPLGFRGVDRWLRLGRWPGLLELAAVLALQVLGGDPESAYLTGLCGGGYALGLIWQGRRGPETRRALPMLAGLAGAAALAATLAAVQIVPSLELLRQSSRATRHGPADLYSFSVEPVRVAEFLWPGVFGSYVPVNRSWLPLVPSVRFLGRFWVPSLYLGGLPIVLALGSLGFRGGPPWRSWLSAVAIVSLLAGLGEYTSPIGWARGSPALAASLGPHDPDEASSPRPDGKPHDGDGGVYWLMATILPGFGLFRYPAKLLSFTALGLAGLAGLGWDRAMARSRSRRAVVLALCLLVPSGLAAVVVSSRSAALASTFLARPEARAGSPFGPFDAAGTVAELERAALHGTVLYVAVLVLLLLGPRRPERAGAAALIVLAADLGLANARLVFTVPQELMDRTPRAVALIEQAEREPGGPATATGPFRVHRLPIWNPLAWFRSSSPARIAEFAAWERDTIALKTGLPYGIEYTLTQGAADLSDYQDLFLSQSRTLDPETARRWNARPGQEVVAYPRAEFDLWNTRYFVITAYPRLWLAENPGIAAYLDDTEVVYPPPASAPEAGPRDWVAGEDFRILRNRRSLPRAWIVHQVEAPGAGPASGDPRHMARADPDTLKALGPGYRPGGVPSGRESATIVGRGPQRVELEAVLKRPGLVVLADVDYPGWRLTIDGATAPIYRVNRLMRGAAVPPGRHRLVYRYAPASFRLGGAITLAGLAALAAFLFAGTGTWRTTRFKKC